LRDPPRDRFLYDYILVDATIPEMFSGKSGEPLAAAKGASGDGDDRHFMMVPCKRPAK
jgi:hypothetical protein